ncbi:hypothetical protein DERP_005592 [Dermatophagoides pteronyssinus]|uniref:Uncharacterized protein n=1 Tax=Dermatophagoides pteronyssinus TaxID=6956 RepID=A0ABQ8J927_DERPT|nr:hypothetical protein DERP_005592 [Dermatophagoides pteronyssinus]
MIIIIIGSWNNKQQITIDDGQCLEVAFTNTMCIRVKTGFWFKENPTLDCNLERSSSINIWNIKYTRAHIMMVARAYRHLPL